MALQLVNKRAAVSVGSLRPGLVQQIKRFAHKKHSTEFWFRQERQWRARVHELTVEDHSHLSGPLYGWFRHVENVPVYERFYNAQFGASYPTPWWSHIFWLCILIDKRLHLELMMWYKKRLKFWYWGQHIDYKNSKYIKQYFPRVLQYRARQRRPDWETSLPH